MDSYFPYGLVIPARTKIVLLIMDGLGGLPLEPGGKTELETARKPNMDALAPLSALGLSMPAGPGITVGSGPGHLALFGYDPFEYEIGRGAMEALGIDFDLGPHDVAARGNFCLVDKHGFILDRRAGRIPTDDARQLASMLRTINIPGVEFFIEPIKEHRFAFIMRGPDLDAALSETDPLKTGVPTLPVKAFDAASAKASDYANEFIEQARRLLLDQSPANMVMLRGFAKLPALPSYSKLYGLRAAAVAINGMYRGVARMAGMQVVDLHGEGIESEFEAVERCWSDFDYFYIHIKETDTCGENGDFTGKVQAIEAVDAFLPRLLRLKPDVLIITGDHSSPAVLKAHSWHPVPVMLYAPYVRADGLDEFGERTCGRGSLGTLPAKQLIRLALSNAGRLAKYGA